MSACDACGISSADMAYIRAAEPSDFDGLNMAGGMADAICCEVEGMSTAHIHAPIADLIGCVVCGPALDLLTPTCDVCESAPAVVSVDLSTFGDDIPTGMRATTRLCADCHARM